MSTMNSMKTPSAFPGLRRMDHATYEREFRACIRQYVSGTLTPQAEHDILRRSEALTALLAAEVGQAAAQQACDRLMAQAADELLAASA